MNRAAGAVTAILAAVITLAACGSGGHPAATVTRTVTAVPSSPSPTAATASPSPSPSSTARLTRKQAARLYVRIIDPMNRSQDALQTDGSDNAPWRQFVADVRTDIRNETRAQHQLLAVRWPVRVEPYVRAMVTTDLTAPLPRTAARMPPRSAACLASRRCSRPRADQVRIARRLGTFSARRPMARQRRQFVRAQVITEAVHSPAAELGPVLQRGNRPGLDHGGRR
jgi:hypothetical protein